MKVAIGSDHAGASLRGQMKAWLETREFEVVDCGADGTSSVDYPDYAGPVSRAVQTETCAWGVLICGSGLGMSIAANRYPGVRAALCRESLSATMARRHNNANVLVLGERFTGVQLAEAILDAWCDAEFEGGRHQRRVDKIDQNLGEKA